MPFNVNVAYTGSSGNCIVIDDEIVIDCGIKVSLIQEYLDNASYLFITHRHGDHLNNACINYLNKSKPWALPLMIYTNPDVIQAIHRHNKLKDLQPENVLTSGYEKFDITTSKQTYHVECFPCEHDVQNQGFIFTNELGEQLIFATDTATMKHAPHRKYDYIVVEGNWDEDKLADMLATDDFDSIFRATRNFRHLSVQALETFINENSHDGTIVYQLHESSLLGIRSDKNTH